MNHTPFFNLIFTLWLIDGNSCTHAVTCTNISMHLKYACNYKCFLSRSLVRSHVRSSQSAGGFKSSLALEFMLK